MGLLREVIHFQTEKKSYYAGIEPNLPYFMRPVSGEGREYEVVERKTGVVHGTYNQRGLAAQTTNRLNGVSS